MNVKRSISKKITREWRNICQKNNTFILDKDLVDTNQFFTEISKEDYSDLTREEAINSAYTPIGEKNYVETYIATDIGSSFFNKVALNDQLSKDSKIDLLKFKAREYESVNSEKNMWHNYKYLISKGIEAFEPIDLYVQNKSKCRKFIVVSDKDEDMVKKIFAIKKQTYQIHYVEYDEKSKMVILIVDHTIGLNRNYHSSENLKWIVGEIRGGGINMGYYGYGYQENEGIQRLSFFSFDMEKFKKPSNVIRGYREDLNASFKSAWEANVARLLNHLKYEWKYEEENIKLTHGYYIPDFHLIVDKIPKTIEIKGRWDKRSILHITEALKYFDVDEFIVIDSDIYYLIEKKYSSKIESWEKSSVSNTSKLKVVGITQKNRGQFLSVIKKGDQVVLEPEPDNEYDENAIKVMYNENHIGYIAKEEAAIHAHKIRLGLKYVYKVANIELDKKYIQISSIVQDNGPDIFLFNKNKK